MFGGWTSEAPASNKVYTYNVNTNETAEIDLPVELGQVFTSTVENLIYVLSADPFTNNNSGQIEVQTAILGVFNTDDNTFEQIDISSLDSILINNSLEQFQVRDNTAYLVTSQNLGQTNGFLETIYAANLN